MKIVTKTIFIFLNKHYDSLEKAQDAEFDYIAEVFDRLVFSNCVLSPGDKLKMMESIYSNKDQLAGLLATHYED